MVLSLYPEDMKVNMMLGGVLSARGEPDEAARFAQKAFEKDPEAASKAVIDRIASSKNQRKE
jgi:hypothetical protein